MFLKRTTPFLPVLCFTSLAMPAFAERGTSRQFDLSVAQLKDFVQSSPSELTASGWQRAVLSPLGEDGYSLLFPRNYACQVYVGGSDAAATARVHCDDMIGAPSPDEAARNMEGDFLGVLSGVISKYRLNHPPEPKAEARKKAVSSDIDKPAYRLPERVNDLALVVGIGRYADLPEAEFAERDAEAVKDHLLALGFPSRNVVLLLGEKAGYKAIEKFVETWLPRHSDASSRVFFYFSGHGAPEIKSGHAYLLPWDGDADYLENTGYPISRLYDKLNALKAKEVFVALDACFSGRGGRSVLPKGARPLVTAVAEDKEGRLTVFAAASGNQVTSALADQGHGTFTYYFLKGLAGAAKSDSGAVTAEGLYRYLKPKVEDAARRQNREQEPVLKGARGNPVLVQFK